MKKSRFRGTRDIPSARDIILARAHQTRVCGRYQSNDPHLIVQYCRIDPSNILIDLPKLIPNKSFKESSGYFS